MSSVTRTMTEGRHSGMMWRNRMRRCEAPCSARGRDEVGWRGGQRLGAGDAGIGRPGGEGDGDHRVLDARAERGDEGEREDQAREGEEDVGDAHQHRVDPAAEIAGRQADAEADRRHDDTAPGQRWSSVMRLPKMTRGIDVAAQFVGAEPDVPQDVGCSRSWRVWVKAAAWSANSGAKIATSTSARTMTSPVIARPLRERPSQARYQRPSRAWRRLAGAGSSSQPRQPVGAPMRNPAALIRGPARADRPAGR